MTREEKVQTDLRDIIVWTKYAQYRPELERRESYDEIIQRVEDMYVDKLPEATVPIRQAFLYVRQGYLLPSMRAMHFAGEGIKRNNSRIYNCAATNIETFLDVRDVMYLLLSGCGVGVSVENTHFERKVSSPDRQIVQYIVPDSIEGWAESMQILLECWQNGDQVKFDYSDIRPKGETIKSINAQAPGPGGLHHAHKMMEEYLEGRIKLRSVDMLHLLCMMASAVMSGGIRRSAMIGLVRSTDKESIELKTQEGWFLKYPYLQYMNISVAWREPFRPQQETFDDLFNLAISYGEPGFFNFGDKEWLTNPCGEILLNDKQFCNLVEVNAEKLTPDNQQEIFSAAALLGFVQSRFTDFTFLQPEWKTQTEKERLVGVSLTGVAGMREEVDLSLGREIVKLCLDGLNSAFGEDVKVPRWTTVKPAGHTSLLLGVSSGIHSYPAPYYLRRITITKDSAMGKYLSRTMHDIFLEEDLFDPRNWKLVVPMKASKGAVCQTDNDEVFRMLDRIEHVNKTWIENGSYEMNNNISATLSVREEDLPQVLDYLYDTTGKTHKGITILTQDDNLFDQPIWEPIHRETYERYLSKWPMFLGISTIVEYQNNTELSGELACAGGGCEVG